MSVFNKCNEEPVYPQFCTECGKQIESSVHGAYHYASHSYEYLVNKHAGDTDDINLWNKNVPEKK